MTPPDDRSLLPTPPPKAEYQADYGAIKKMFWIAIGCAVIAVLFMLFNKSGIGSALDTPRNAPGEVRSPILDENYGAVGQRTAAGALTHDLWKWGGLLALVSVIGCVVHLLRGSFFTRFVLRGLLAGWACWTIASVLLPLNVSSTLPARYSGYDDVYGAKTPPQLAEQNSGNSAELVMLACFGLGGCLLLGLTLRRPDYEMDFVEPATAGARKSEESTSELDVSAFRLWGFIFIFLFTFLPAVLTGLLGDGDGLVYAFTIWLTFPAWIIIDPWTEGVDGFQLLLFGSWVAISLLLCMGQLRAPSSGKTFWLLSNQLPATLLVWASLPHVSLSNHYLHAGLIFGVSLGIAMFGGILLCIPVRRIHITRDVEHSDRAYLQVAPGVFAEPVSGFCGNCGQLVHARDGQCLTCGNAIDSV